MPEVRQTGQFPSTIGKYGYKGPQVLGFLWLSKSLSALLCMYLMPPAAQISGYIDYPWNQVEQPAA